MRIIQISNVGFHDVSNQDVSNALTVNTMLIHGSTKSLGSITNTVSRPTDDDARFIGCSSSCGFHDEVGASLGLSSFCDTTTCAHHDIPTGSISKRLGCGAGDPTKFGPACRLCVTEGLEKLDEKYTRLQRHLTSRIPDVSIIMCPSNMTSKFVTCSQQCSDELDTVRTLRNYCIVNRSIDSHLKRSLYFAARFTWGKSTSIVGISEHIH